MQSDFDIAATNYDKNFTNTSIGKAQRLQVYQQIKNIINQKKVLQILELNCGTGEDANYFSSFNHQVLATDISSKMVSVASKKFKNSNINFQQLDIKELKNKTFKKKFDLVFSNFGGFNCLSKNEIAVFLKSAQNILTSQGKIVLVIMPKHTIWEKIYFTFKVEFKKINRRNSNNSIAANVDGINVKTWYFNPNEIVKIAEGYTVQKIKPIGLFVPPSYLQSSFLGNKTVVSFLNTLDTLLGFSFFANFADHYYIELKKNTEI